MVHITFQRSKHAGSLTFIAVGVFRIFNKTVKLFFITRLGVIVLGGFWRYMHAHLLVLSTPRKPVRDFCCLQRTFTSEETSQTFPRALTSISKSSFNQRQKTRVKHVPQPREPVKIEYYIATKHLYKSKLLQYFFLSISSFCWEWNFLLEIYFLRSTSLYNYKYFFSIFIRCICIYFIFV